MSDKCVCGAVGELPIASLGTGLQQTFAAISPNTTTACMGYFKLANATLARAQGHTFKGGDKVLAVEGSECTIKWQTEKKASYP